MSSFDKTTETSGNLSYDLIFTNKDKGILKVSSDVSVKLTSWIQLIHGFQVVLGYSGFTTTRDKVNYDNKDFCSFTLTPTSNTSKMQFAGIVGIYDDRRNRRFIIASRVQNVATNQTTSMTFQQNINFEINSTYVSSDSSVNTFRLTDPIQLVPTTTNSKCEYVLLLSRTDYNWCVTLQFTFQLTGSSSGDSFIDLYKNYYRYTEVSYDLLEN